MNAGIAYATLAFVMWGLFPLYFRQIAAVPPLEVVLHRSVWSLLFVLLLLAVLRRFGWLKPLLREPRRLGTFALSALLLSGNWLVYVYAVQSGQVVEASLGYFINPIVSVLLGVLVLHERLNRVQWAAVALAAAGVLWLTVLHGRLPWIALVLAVSFGLYGLMRKTASLGALEGLALETLLLAPLVVPALLWWTLRGHGAMAQGDVALDAWLVIGGPLTALPLLLFAAGARRLPLATVGLLQYLSPTIQLALGVWVFHEPFDATRLAGFAFIWAALLLYSLDGLRRSRAAPNPQPQRA
jgi:chloramphenicol-sensitive protein RarD